MLAHLVWEIKRAEPSRATIDPSRASYRVASFFVQLYPRGASPFFLRVSERLPSVFKKNASTDDCNRTQSNSKTCKQLWIRETTCPYLKTWRVLLFLQVNYRPEKLQKIADCKTKMSEWSTTGEQRLVLRRKKFQSSQTQNKRKDEAFLM
jgi:hypothetical protein